MKRIHKGSNIKHCENCYIVVDIETTGFNYPRAEIIEICAKKYINHQLVGEFKTLLKPKGQISDFITKLTGITHEMVQNAPLAEQCLPQFIEFIEDTPLIAHNANFDVDFLYDTCTDLIGIPVTNDYIDTLQLSRQSITGVKNHKLHTLAQHFNLDSPTHRAEQDVDVTQALYMILTEFTAK